MADQSIDVCFSFDTTGSMYPCLAQVKRTVQKTIKTLFKDIDDLRIAIIAHGDYCDDNDPYITKIQDFCDKDDQNVLIDFIKDVERTWGGDAPECYELVLHEARTQLNWKSGRSKVLVMIGDDVPHDQNYPLNTKHIDWKNELGLLNEANVNVYGVHCMPGIRKRSKSFYEELAKSSGGFYLSLEQFNSVVELIMAVCYKQDSDEQFNQYVESINPSRAMKKNLRILGYAFAAMEEAEEGKTYAFEEDGLEPVEAGRFQVMTLDDDMPIKKFVQDQGIDFKVGRGFYELTKTVDVQAYKELLLVDKESGDIFTGPQVRNLLEMPEQEEGNREKFKLRPVNLKEYKVFVQSTSHNRKLLAGTDFMYEVEDWEK